MRIAYQGGPGAFGHEACYLFMPECEPVPQERFADVPAAVIAGKAERGVLPVENSIAGAVPGNAELVADDRLELLDRRDLPVRMHLMALPGVKLEDIRTVISHPMAIKQSLKGLTRLGVETEEASNTALAAANLRRRDCGVLASEAAATAYGLHILFHDLHDRPDNFTTFALFARKADG